jgi:ABC-type phosphate transport system auxiliary subunit
MQKDAEIAEVKKKLKEAEKKFDGAKIELEKHIAVIKEFEGKILTIEEEKLVLSQKLVKSESDLELAQK